MVSLLSKRKGLWPAIIGQFLGFGMDSYDMALVVVLAPILSKLFLPLMAPNLRYVVILMAYSVTLAARPIGSAIFGHYADKIGRRRLLLITMSSVGIIAFLIGLLPTYEQVGYLSYWLLITLRLLMGIFFGGEYAVGHAFAMEFAPAKRRGLLGGIVQSGFPLGFALGSFVVAGISSIMGQAMATIGWRIVFFTGMIPAFVAFGLIFHAPESPEFERIKKAGEIEKHPFISLFKPPTLWTFLQVFAFMTGIFLTDYAIYGFIPKILTLGGRGFSIRIYSEIYGVGLFIAFLGYIFYGLLSDIFGRKKLTIVYSIYVMVVIIPALHYLYEFSLMHDIIAATIATILATSCKLTWGMLPAYLSERFPTKKRSVGVGFGYSSGTFIGAWFNVYIWLIHCVPAIKAIEGNQLWLSPGVLAIIGAILTLSSMLFSPETKGISLAEVKE